MKKYLKVLSAVCAVSILIASLSFAPAVHADAAAPVTICIDAGHGGTNMGAQYNGRNEKDMTVVVANAMYSYLSNFEGINVVMTRTADAELSLQQRCDIAHAAGAQFIFCIHFNAIGDHSRYGCENWVSAFGDNCSKGLTFGNIETNALAQMGIVNRGVKTRLNSARNADYYGIIKHCDEYGIPSVIIEHCYVDNPIDYQFCATSDQLMKLGVVDATSVAQYYGLKSTKLGIDYSGYKKTIITPANGVQYPDYTAPDACSIAKASVDASHNSAVINVGAYDKQSRILYYAYSTDGGLTYSQKLVWSGTNANYVVPITVKLDGKQNCPVQFIVWNNFDEYTVSNMITVN